MIEESTDSLNAALTGRLTYLNEGTGRAEIRVYGGTRAASPTAAPGTPLLVAIALQDPAGSVSAGVLTLLGDGPATVQATGTATWARAVNGNGDTAFDMDAGADGTPGKECLLSDTALTEGAPVTLVSAVLE